MDYPSLKNIITLVSGFPRSGTSTMMRMLYLGGLMPVAHESTLKANTEDTSYLFNPSGYFELKNVGVTLANEDLTWMRGRVLKLVAPYIRHLPANRKELKFKAILLERDISEIIASLMTMRTVYEETPGEAVRYALDFMKHWDIPVHIVKFKEMIKYPKATAIGVADFLEADLDIDKMVKAINKNPRKLLDEEVEKLDQRRIITFVDGKTADIYTDKAPEEEDLKVCGKE